MLPIYLISILSLKFNRFWKLCPQVPYNLSMVLSFAFWIVW
jgi:hypothetical protein